eukprot:Rhum_TRINITY_DN9943_c0_g1::Rhum_TRINITY_DN9943_c0_g1_i1::g.36075::m.36075
MAADDTDFPAASHFEKFVDAEVSRAYIARLEKRMEEQKEKPAVGVLDPSLPAVAEALFEDLQASCDTEVEAAGLLSVDVDEEEDTWQQYRTRHKRPADDDTDSSSSSAASSTLQPQEGAAPAAAGAAASPDFGHESSSDGAGEEDDGLGSYGCLAEGALRDESECEGEGLCDSDSD